MPAEPVEGVSRVVNYLKRLLSHNSVLAGLRVRGEVSGLKPHAGGRLYFSLKEGADVLHCVAWPSDAASLPPFREGDAVICGGEFGVRASRSEYQLVVKTLEPTGIGALYAQFEELRERFSREGLFEADRKRPMPVFPRRIAVVSATGGKGSTDFFTTIAKRAPHIDVRIVETRVQGDGAQIDIADAIDRAARLGPDVIVLTRGGGSYEDLFPFNLEPVIRAIVRSSVPVLSAIGHTEDVHLSDYVADRTCETPSNAAQYFGEIADRCAGRIQRAEARLEHAASAVLRAHDQMLDDVHQRLERASLASLRALERVVERLARRIDAQNPQRRLAQRRERLDAFVSRLTQARANAFHAMRRRFELLEARLNGSDPQAPLLRGYAIVTLDGHVVRSARDVPKGALIQAKVQHGVLAARVEGSEIDG